jgi:hypothetical protein
VRALGLGIAAALLLAAVPSTATAEVVQQGSLRVSLDAELSPHALPRARSAPVGIEFSGQILTTDGADPPQLRRIVLRLNRHGRIDTAGLPRCRLDQIQPARTDEARQACGASLVGGGTFKADVALPDQSPYPSNGRILAFNGVLDGRPVIFVHIYGTEPLPTSNVLAFKLSKEGGQFGTKLVAELPQVASDWGFVSGLDLTLRRTFRRKGETRSYLSARCPAPEGFRAAPFTLAHVVFDFEDGRTLGAPLTRSCGVRR